MNILLINHYAGSTEHGMEYRPYYIAREWVRLGHSVHIVAASYSHVRTHQPEFSGNRGDEQIDGIHYTWLNTPSYVGNGLGRVRNMATFVFRLFYEAHTLVSNFRPDVVIASSTYPMDIWPARRIAKLAGAKLVFEVHDLWPLTPMELGGMSKWHPFVMLVQMAEGHAYAHADTVVSMLPKAQDYMASRGMRIDKFHYVPNGFSMLEWENGGFVCLPENIQSELDKARSIKALTIVYAGSHAIQNALDNLLNAASILLSENVRFILVGDGCEKRRLQLRVKNEKLKNVFMFEPIEKKAIPNLLAQVDIAYLGAPLKPIYRFGVSPNKMFDYMMAGLPILYAIESGNNPIADAECGIVVVAENSKALSREILTFKALPLVEKQKMSLNGARYAKDNYSYDRLAINYCEAIKWSDNND